MKNEMKYLAVNLVTISNLIYLRFTTEEKSTENAKMEQRIATQY